MKKILGLLLSLIASTSLSMQLVPSKLDKKFTIYKDRVITLTKTGKMHVDSSAISAPEKFGTLGIYHDKQGFYVHKDDKKCLVKKEFTDKLVRNINKKQLRSFLENGGYLSLNQMENGDYSLKANVRLNGGGPNLGVFMYWLTKSVCYGVIAAGVGTATVVTGGAAAGAITGAATTVAGVTVGSVAAATTTTAAIGTTAGVVTGTAAAGVAIGTSAGVVGGAIAGASAAGATVAGVELAAGAALATGAAGTAVGTVGVVGGIEALSIAIGTFFGMLPTP